MIASWQVSTRGIKSEPLNLFIPPPVYTSPPPPPPEISQKILPAAQVLYLWVTETLRLEWVDSD